MRPTDAAPNRAPWPTWKHTAEEDVRRTILKKHLRVLCPEQQEHPPPTNQPTKPAGPHTLNRSIGTVVILKTLFVKRHIRTRIEICDQCPSCHANSKNITELQLIRIYLQYYSMYIDICLPTYLLCVYSYIHLHVM